jgi:glucose-6-phosphate isomerase, archaeal
MLVRTDDTPVAIDFATGHMRGDPIEVIERRIGDLGGVFEDQAAWAAADAGKLAYRVEWWRSVPEGTPGGLFFGNTFIEPGVVGNEFLMTKGHLHSRAETAEYYWCLRGEGVLLLMDADRKTRTQRMTPGSLHYVPGHTAHRCINTGDEQLVFHACWPSDAGHNYAAIARAGFSARVFRRADGVPQVMERK